MIVTTAGRTNVDMMKYAQEIARDLGGTFVMRGDASVQNLQAQISDHIIVVGKNRLELYPYGGNESFFFHPNSASFRLKRLVCGEPDPFLEVARLQEGMTVLDCTLGLASDSIIASYAVGTTGSVTGVEGNPYMAYIVEQGLQKWNTDFLELKEAMQRISVVHTEHITFLRSCPDNRFDVVYFDPMFEESILESDGIRGLKHFALYTDITAETIQEALRVAKQRVVLKDHFRSSRFEMYGFSVKRRKTATFHFGSLEK